MRKFFVGWILPTAVLFTACASSDDAKSGINSDASVEVDVDPDASTWDPGPGPGADSGGGYAGQGGDSETGGTGGNGGGSGSGGTGGNGGSGGAGGNGGSGGSGDDGGTGGNGGGSGSGGTGGNGGSGGAGGNGGSGGSGGTGGNGGSGGSGGTGGNGGSGGGGGTGGAPAAYTHTISIDGNKDFSADDTFTTTSDGYTGFISWDKTNLFVGMDGPDIGSHDGNKFVIIYIGNPDSNEGTTTGLTYNTQGPELPFKAQWQIHWKCSNDNTRAVAWNGSAWTDAAWNFTGKVFRLDTYLEMAIPLDKFGSPNKLDVHLVMINERGGGEWTYAGVPSTSFTDSVDPNYTKYFQFDFKASTLPKDYNPKP